MFCKISSGFKKMALLGSILACMCLTACNGEEAKPFELSESAMQYSFPKDNLLALKSVAVDSGEGENRYIFEFDSTSEYLYKEGLEGILEEMKKDPSNYWYYVAGYSEGEAVTSKVQAVYGKKTNYLIVYSEPKVECSHVKIGEGIVTLDIYAPWEKPSIEIVRYYCEQDGKEGTLYREQDYDEIGHGWNAYTLTVS